jgi:hypothetical protein
MRHTGTYRDGDCRARLNPNVRPARRGQRKSRPGVWRGTSSASSMSHLVRWAGVTTAIASGALIASATPAAASAASWRIEEGKAMEDPPPDNLLFSASCPSAKLCVAVGYDGHGDFQSTLVETMIGKSWRVTPSAVTASPYIDDSLDSVSCSSPSSCAAVGSATDVTGTKEHALVETLRRGTWTVTPSPDTHSALNSLAGVSCPSSTSCVAVGYAGTPDSQRTLVENLSRGQWQISPSPVAHPPFVVNFLNAVSCISPTHCVAAGFAAGPTGMESRTLIETLNGRVWKLTPSPNTSSPINELYGVQCTSPASCVAVGDDGSLTSQRTLVETLSAGTWRLTTSPDTSFVLNQLFHTWCSSSTSCVATGYALNAQGTEARTLVESLRRGAWRITASPDTSSPINEFYGYSCASPSSCYAVGVEGTTLAQEALIETTAGRS